ncbi:MAG: helix-turn-helix transcriptional regulator [Lachnospiraceae bacterium]|nr:helix-turn-helix transcriptional regulator [Lachnospiraceae bacterium]
MAKELNEAIGGRIRAYRESLGMNRESFSEQVGLSPQFLAEVENGKKGLSAESIYKICSSSELSADYLVMGTIKRDKLKNPLDNVIQDMPGDYSVQCAKVLQAVNDIITEAQRDGMELYKKFNK